MTNINSSFEEALVQLAILNDAVAAAEAELADREAAVYAAKEVLRNRINSGNSSGDRVADLVIEFMDNIGLSMIGKFEKFEESLKRKRGQLVALHYSTSMVTGRVFGRGTQRESRRAVRIGVLQHETLQVVPKEDVYHRLTLGCSPCVLLYEPLPYTFGRPLRPEVSLFGHTFADGDIEASCWIGEYIKREPSPHHSWDLLIGDEKVEAFLQERVIDPAAFMDTAREALGQLVLTPPTAD